jgi:hypothetical protein
LLVLSSQLTLRLQAVGFVTADAADGAFRDGQCRAAPLLAAARVSR